jgi:pimeloyl-ACP methyl ester carboxylesterase
MTAVLEASGLAVHWSGDDGRPHVVLLHGVGNNGSTWSDLMEALPDYHCLAPDLPGHGVSRHIPWRSRADTARMIATLIEAQVGNGRAQVVGLSLGGSVALELLATRPELLDHVVVDGCGALPSRLTGPMKVGVSVISPFLRFAPVARLVGRAFGVQPGDGLDDFVAQMQAVEPRSFRRAFADANDTRITPSLLASPCRTLFVAGERELGHVRASNRLLAQQMSRARARMVPGANHGWGPAQYPDLHRRMIVAWLEDQPLPDALVFDVADRIGQHSSDPIGEIR